MSCARVMVTKSCANWWPLPHVALPMLRKESLTVIIMWSTADFEMLESYTVLLTKLGCSYLCFMISECAADASDLKWMLQHLGHDPESLKESTDNQQTLLCVFHTYRIFFSFFFSLVRWKLQSPRWRWQCIAGPSGFRRPYGLRECGLARFPFWVARRGGRTAADVLLSDCQYRKGTSLYGRCGV